MAIEYIAGYILASYTFTWFYCGIEATQHNLSEDEYKGMIIAILFAPILIWLILGYLIGSLYRR